MPIPAEVQPIARVRTRERACDVIRDWIVAGELAPGETVRDADLARALGVSRTPVRVALVELEREGLIERDAAGHLRIARIDVDDLECIIPIRLELEALAARLAAERGADVGLMRRANQELRRIVEGIRDPHDAAAATAVREANDAFHLAVLAGAGNPRLSDYLGGLRVLHQRYETLYFSNPARVGALSSDDHDAITAAIAARDPDAAATAMRLHFSRAWDLVARLRSGDGRGVVAV